MKKYILTIISIILVIFIFNIVSAFNFKEIQQALNINNDTNENNNKMIDNILDVLNDLQSLPNGSVDKVQKETLSEFEYSNDVGTEIIKCLKGKDKQGLSDLFCDKIKGSDYLMNEIDIIFDYIDKNGGLIIGDGEWQVPTSHGSNGYNGKTVKYLSCKYSEVIKIGNKEYNLRFTAYQIMKGHLDYQGVNNIYFAECTNDDVIKRMNKNNNNQNAKKFLGFDLLNVDYENYVWQHIYTIDFYENDLYKIPEDLEVGRSKW